MNHTPSERSGPEVHDRRRGQYNRTLPLTKYTCEAEGSGLTTVRPLLNTKVKNEVRTTSLVRG